MSRPLTQIELNHEENRQNLWVKVWLTIAGDDTCGDIDIPTKWADRALKDFDERFQKPDVYEETQCGFVKKDCK